MNIPKKHHYVPQFVLREFANENSRLLVRRVDSAREYLANVTDVGHRNRGHSLVRPGGEVNDELLEFRMSELEAEVSVVLNRLKSARSADLDPALRETLGWFLALQWYRSRFIIDHLNKEVDKSHESGLTAAEKNTGMLTVGAISLLDAWSNSRKGEGDLKDQWNNIVTLLNGFYWRVSRYKRDVLVQSDNIVCLSGIAVGHEREIEVPPAWTKHGVGVGFGTCRRITVPLTPRLGLHLDRNGSPGHITADRFNELTIANSREFIACHPSWSACEPKLNSSAEDRIRLQRMLRPVLG